MNPIFIVTTGENGAGLVTGLLDSHPQLAVLPFLFDFYRKYDKARSVHDLTRLIVDYPMIARVFDGGSAIAYGDFRGLKFSRPDFVADFSARVGTEMPGRKKFFEAAFLSLCKAFGIATDGKTPVAHIHFTDNAADYAADFPNARWIICDAKRENMMAYSSHLIASVLPKHVIPYRVQMKERNVTLDQRQADAANLPSPHRVMFEDLLTDPRHTADALADWLKIDPSPSLYNSTVLSRPLSCTYPTGTISIVNGKITARISNGRRCLMVAAGSCGRSGFPIIAPSAPSMLHTKRATFCGPSGPA
jgi:hypothetical protein